MDDCDRELLDIAYRQLGLVTREQVEKVGLNTEAWLHRRRREHWRPVTGEVWIRSGAPTSEHTLALAAVLHYGSGAAISHHSAAALWGVPGFRLAPIHVAVPRPRYGGHGSTVVSDPSADRRDRRNRPTRVIVHRPRAWPPRPVGVLDGIPVVRPALLVLQLAPWVAPQRLQRVLDNLWSRRLVSGSSIATELEPVMCRGRAGVTALRELLDRCGPDYVPPASNLERRLIDLVEQAGLPPLLRQVNLGDHRRWCGRVDLFWPQWLIIVEVDSDRYHLALSDRDADAERQAALEAAGFRVVRVTEFELWHRRDVVIERLREAIRAARRPAMGAR
ncbi:MAG: DUF559 domain-containing protein [Microthrixaceae bacterium]